MFLCRVIRKAGISEQTFYRWKAKYAGLEVDQARQMAQLQEDNLRLTRLGGEDNLRNLKLECATLANLRVGLLFASAGGSIAEPLAALASMQREPTSSCALVRRTGCLGRIRAHEEGEVSLHQGYTAADISKHGDSVGQVVYGDFHVLLSARG